MLLDRDALNRAWLQTIKRTSKWFFRMEGKLLSLRSDIKYRCGFLTKKLKNHNFPTNQVLVCYTRPRETYKGKINHVIVRTFYIYTASQIKGVTRHIEVFGRKILHIFTKNL